MWEIKKKKKSFGNYYNFFLTTVVKLKKRKKGNREEAEAIQWAVAWACWATKENTKPGRISMAKRKRRSSLKLIVLVVLYHKKNSFNLEYV